jgi:hypothetical protein
MNSEGRTREKLSVFLVCQHKQRFPEVEWIFQPTGGGPLRADGHNSTADFFFNLDILISFRSMCNDF